MGLPTSGSYHHTIGTFKINTFLVSCFKIKSALISFLLVVVQIGKFMKPGKVVLVLVLAGCYSRGNTILVKNTGDGTLDSPYNHNWN